MEDLSDDSDCFESADEGLDDEKNIAGDNIKCEVGDQDPDRSETSSPLSSALTKESSGETDPSGSNLQYRKRPERGKSANKPVQSILPITRKTSLNEQIFNTDIIKPDVLIQDITSNLSKNFNKGFSTIQQTSSSIKDLVVSSLPITNLRQNCDRFSYDDEEEISCQVFDSDDDGEIALENDVEQHEQPIQNEKIVVADEKIDLSSVKDTEEALGSNLCNQMGAVVTSESSDVTEVEKEYTHGENSNVGFHVVSPEGSGDGVCPEPQEMKGTEEDEVLFGETKDLSGTIEESIRKKILEHEADTIVKGLDEELPDKYKKENFIEETHEQCDWNAKDGWDSSELELEITDVGDSPQDDSMNVNDSTLRQNLKPDAKEKIQKPQENEASDDNEGWDDFDIDDQELEVAKSVNKPVENAERRNNELSNRGTDIPRWDENKNFGNDSKWSGWDNFGEKEEPRQTSSWKLGSWGVNALLNTATSVTQGLTNVIEAGLGVPDPETLARMEHKSAEDEDGKTPKENVGKQSESSQSDENSGSGLNIFPSFGITNLVVGVTKNIVENAKVQEIGTKVIAGGLDTLESFGKKTMEVLQEGDPGLKKKRALLLGSGKPILSQVLREAKSKAEIEDRRMEEKQMARLCHFETLFDDFQGLIHLEALEMLSRQCELKLEQMKDSLSRSEFQDLNGILDEVKELCVIDEDEFKSNYSTMVDIKLSLTKATEPLRNEISVLKIVEVYEELDSWMKNGENTKKSATALFQKAMSALAELTAATVAQFHKGGELLSIKEHRKTVEEADALLQMTGFMCCEINNISNKFLKLHTNIASEKEMEMADKIREEASNATSYIKDAFNLLIPVLQLGAAT